MKKMKLLLVLSTSFLLMGCSLPINQNTSSSDDITDTNNYDEDPTDDVINDGEDNTYDEVVVPEENIDTPSSYDSFGGKTITSAGKYYLSGAYSVIEITAPKGSELFVFLDGVEISNNEGIAFSSSKQIILHLVLLNNSLNTINNNFSDANSFHVKGNVLISGSGTLNITSSQKNGLKVSKDLYVYDGVTLNVTGANHAISARSIISKGASISVVSDTKDGLQLECDSDVTEFTKEQGFAYLIDTKFTAKTHGDGIQADTYIYISGGEYNITTYGEFISYSTQNMNNYGLSTDDFKYVKSGSDYKRVATDEIRTLTSSYYALKNSVKGIKAGVIEYDTDDDDVDDVSVTTGDYEIYIAHLAKITIDSTDDCIHANYGKVNIDNSNLDLNTYDDGVHADYDLKLNSVSIGINKSYEGLEGANVVIDGEDTNIVTNSQDDGINAASDLVSNTNITINNGYLRVYASGDGLDANKSLNINGGTVIVEGPGSGNGSLDSDSIKFNGGIVFACSTNGMRESMSANQYTFIYQGSSMAANSLIKVVDETNTPLFSYTLKQSCNQLIFSHPDMKANATYRIFVGSSSVASITMTSKLVTYGSGGGGGGGHGPNH